MNCPECGRETSVINSRPIRSGASIRRRRACPNGHRFSTEEAIVGKKETPPKEPCDSGRPDPDYHIGERLTGGWEDYVDISPAEAKDSIKYACMTIGFSHRPIPKRGRRKDHCSVCGALKCVHHKNLTPQEMTKLRQAPTRYPEYPAVDYADV